MQHCKRLSVIQKIWNVVLRVRVTSGLWTPPWPINQNAE